jgi:Tol biopolymer transport system component
MVEFQERTCSRKKVRPKRAPVSVHILLFVCALYSAVQLLMLLVSISIPLMTDNIVYPFISGVLALVPWVCILVAGVFGLWKRRVWGWAIWLLTSFWFICSGIPTIDIVILSLIPTFEIIAYFVFLLLWAPGVRRWCRVDPANASAPIFAVLAFFLGWIWSSVVLHEHYLPPDIAEISSLMVVCSIICWLLYWVAAYSMTKGKTRGVVLAVLASILSTATLVASLLGDWFGLQQRVFWAYSTIFGNAGLWISVRDSLSLLGIILIAANLLTAIMLIVFRQKVLMRDSIVIENIRPKEPNVLEIAERTAQVKLLKCVVLLLCAVPVILVGGVFITSALDLHSTVVKSEALGDPRNPRNCLQFSPNGKTVAYLWRDATYYRSWTPGVRPRTMTDALEVRWFPVGVPENEKSVSLDSIDLRPDGQTYYNLDGELCFSPDSQNLAAVCANYIIIIDVERGNSEKLHYEGEWFGSLRWLSEQEIVFCTEDNHKVTFWRLNTNDDKNSRAQIYEEEGDYSTSAGLPPRLLAHRRMNFSFSPDAQSVLFTIVDQNELALRLLNLETGETEIFHLNPFGVSWKPDGTQVLMNEYDYRIDGGQSKLHLVKIDTMEITELTEQFRQNIGKDVDILHISLPCSLWTPDGKYVVFNLKEKIPYQRNSITGKIYRIHCPTGTI